MKSVFVDKVGQLITDDYLPKADDADVKTIINIVFSIIASIAVLMVVYSSIQFITSQGNSDKVATARKTIIYTAFGLVIMSVAWAVVIFVINQFGVDNPSPQPPKGAV